MASLEANPIIPNRTIVEEVPGWLILYSDGTVERSGPPEAGPLLNPVAPYDEPRNGITVHDLTTDPPIRVYLPEGTTSPGQRLPILLHFHGGGFCLSHPSWLLYHDFYAKVATTLKVAAVLSPVYPLAPEHRLPAAIDSVFSALLWLRSVGTGEVKQMPVVERLRETIDFSRVFLIGDSAGGNLVHEVCARAGSVGPRLLHPVRVAGGILLNPGFARSKRSRSELENPESPFLNLEMIDKLLTLAVPAGATKDHPYVCPMGKDAPAIEGLKMPPLLLVVGDKDLLRDPQLEYYEAMKKAGKEVELLMSHDMSHIFYLNKFAVEGDPVTGERTKELVQKIKMFVESDQ
ncbi:alpha/beta-Hydrolases superfamily protein [Rhynchospora pubera]|uniref:Alpha/beta-Hydrolases superfamily protein n=1 Tax=Rhynchospora pubera TaxID=906938 RepID=A0AAV8F1S8_9POAL|nr:alpha/beta-Hydrolases superfamily protein [Rhynchospora pubera]